MENRWLKRGTLCTVQISPIIAGAESMETSEELAESHCHCHWHTIHGGMIEQLAWMRESG
jgi:hypothetical protein